MKFVIDIVPTGNLSESARDALAIGIQDWFLSGSGSFELNRHMAQNTGIIFDVRAADNESFDEDGNMITKRGLLLRMHNA